MKTYPLFKAHIPIDQALANIEKVFGSGFINEGLQVTQLTDGLQHVLAAKNLVLINSCTSALTLSLHLAGVDPGDEVITTPMTCVATNAPIKTRNANIVWADVDPNDGMISPDDVANKITDRTKAVIAVAWAGTPPKLQRLFELCKQRNVKLILDAAHAFGARYKDSPIHEWADYTCYSFQAIKHFTTGDGGGLVCLRDEDHERAKALKWFGLDRDRAKDALGNWKGQQWDADIVEAGYKFNMNNVAAAIGLAQLPYIDNIIKQHRRHASLYDLFFLSSSSCNVVPVDRPEFGESSHWVYTMKLFFSPLSRDELLKRLNAEGIMAGVVHVPNDDYTAFVSSRTDLSGLRAFSSQQFSLPCGWWLDDDDIRHIADRVKSISQYGV